ncbi:1-acyl-sn-glycerol-3-phosphate acyltransferase [Flavobacteriales bacterium]|nr:1-acyl-sn-glycerol-3-phosphate acyltransferase [Flavobacteriales bacterium]
MSKLFWPLKILWRGWFFVCCFITLMPLFPFFYYFVHREEHFKKAMFLKRIWARMILLLAGVWTTVELEDKLKNGPYIIVPNHVSFVDIVQSYVAFPGYFHYMGRVQLGNWWFFNIFFHKMNILIDRNNLRASYNSYQRAADDLKKGITIAVYPESIIPDNPPEMLPFKNSPFKIAIETQVPVVPVTFVNGWNILPAKPHVWEGGRPGKTFIKIHKPIPSKGMTAKDVAELRDAAQDVIRQELKRHGHNG